MMYVLQTKVLLIALSLISFRELKNVSTRASDIVANNYSLWSEASKLGSFLFEKCILSSIKGNNQLYGKDNAVAILEDCLKRRGLRALDRALSRDVIQISDNVVIVKWKNDTVIDDESGRYRSQKKFNTSKSVQVINDWDRQLIEKVLLFLKTRIVKIRFKGLTSDSTTMARGRHRDKSNTFGQMMLFGLVAAGFIVIPLGFQFLAVLGGKALLLAKLALLLTSIQGLKKIATSHVNYGLYSTGHDGPWHYDRKLYYEGDQYPSTYYTSALGTPLTEHYVYSTDHSSTYNNLHPRKSSYS